MLLAERYNLIRAQTEKICKDLNPEDTVVQAADFASPVKWHLAHGSWFFETFILKRFLKAYREYDAAFHFLFNSYYESLGGRVARDRRGLLTRPLIKEVYQYRQHVDKYMQHILELNTDKELNDIIELGLQHEQQHQELLVTDTKYMFAQNPLFPAWRPGLCHSLKPLSENTDWLPVKEGVFEIGYDGKGFCFDNELGLHRQYLENFFIAGSPVSNGEYLEFIESGGYNNFSYWLADGWSHIAASANRAPLYWQKNGSDWYTFGFGGLEKINPGLPAMHLNYYEADAFARWKGMRLPTEFEHEAAARLYPAFFEPCVWEWTQSAYLPYPGFTIATGAVGEYNGKFMVNQMVLRGASIATPEGHNRPSYRNFFSPHLQWQFSGVRLAKDVITNP